MVDYSGSFAIEYSPILQPAFTVRLPGVWRSRIDGLPLGQTMDIVVGGNSLWAAIRLATSTKEALLREYANYCLRNMEVHGATE